MDGDLPVHVVPHGGDVSAGDDVSARDEFVRWALAQVGKPYSTYRDCSGFSAAAARQVGITIPEGSVAQFGVGQRTFDYADEPGLLHFWDTYDEAPGHVGIGIGGGKVVHAMNESVGITISSLRANMGGKNRYMGARRFITEGAPDPEEPTGKPPKGSGPEGGESGSNPGPSTVTRKDRKRREKDRQRRGGRRGRR